MTVYLKFGSQTDLGYPWLVYTKNMKPKCWIKILNFKFIGRLKKLNFTFMYSVHRDNTLLLLSIYFIDSDFFWAFERVEKAFRKNYFLFSLVVKFYMILIASWCLFEILFVISMERIWESLLKFKGKFAKIRAGGRRVQRVKFTQAPRKKGTDGA